MYLYVGRASECSGNWKAVFCVLFYSVLPYMTTFAKRNITYVYQVRWTCRDCTDEWPMFCGISLDSVTMVTESYNCGI